jgi:hypothetical protein
MMLNLQWNNDVVLGINLWPSVIEKTSGFESLELFSLIASDDVLAGSPNFVFEVLQMDQDYWEMLMVLFLVNPRRQFCSIKGNFWQNIQTYQRRIFIEF